MLQKSDSRLFIMEATQRLIQVVKVFFPMNMGGGVVFGLIVTRVCVSVCDRSLEAVCFH